MVVTLVLFSNTPLPLSQLLPLSSLHFPPSWIMITAFLRAHLRVFLVKQVTDSSSDSGGEELDTTSHWGEYHSVFNYFLIFYVHLLVYVYACAVTQSCPTLCDPHGLQPSRLFCLRNFLGKNTGATAKIQEIFPNKGSNL